MHAISYVTMQAGDNGDTRATIHPVTRQNISHAMKIQYLSVTLLYK